MEARTYVSGKTLRSAAAMVVRDLRLNAIEEYNGCERSKCCWGDDKRLDCEVW